MNDTNPTAPLVSAVDVKVHFKIAESFLAQRLAGATSVTIRAVDGLSLDVYPGETVGLVGESGCGKSTFGRTTVGLLPPTAGQVLFDGEPIWGPGGRLSHRALRQRAQIVFQNPQPSTPATRWPTPSAWLCQPAECPVNGAGRRRWSS